MGRESLGARWPPPAIEGEILSPTTQRESPRPSRPLRLWFDQRENGKSKGPRRPAPAYEGLDGVGTKPSRREAIEGERFSPTRFSPQLLFERTARCSLLRVCYVPVSKKKPLRVSLYQQTLISSKQTPSSVGDGKREQQTEQRSMRGSLLFFFTGY